MIPCTVKNDRNKSRKKTHSPREPKQSRGQKTKEKIIAAALDAFCQKGYYKTSTNEIAQRAGVSIGSLYAYFSDKDTIFLEILDQYHQKFVAAKETVFGNTELMHSDLRQWIRLLIEHLILVHEETRELNRELMVLSFYNDEVAAILERNKEETMKATIGQFLSVNNDTGLEDPEAAAIVTFDLISATVDRIVFGKNEIDRSRLVDTTIDVLYSWFKKLE